MTGNYWCCHLAIIRPCLVHISVGLGRSHRGSNLDSALVGCYFFRCYMCIYYQPGTAGQLIFRVSVGLEFEFLTSLWIETSPQSYFLMNPTELPFDDASPLLWSWCHAGVCLPGWWWPRLDDFLWETNEIIYEALKPHRWAKTNMKWIGDSAQSNVLGFKGWFELRAVPWTSKAWKNVGVNKRGAGDDSFFMKKPIIEH